MKKLLMSAIIALTAMLLFSGCVALGGGSKTENHNPTVGQQLIDLQKARDTGAINDVEYQSQKAKLLGH